MKQGNESNCRYIVSRAMWMQYNCNDSSGAWKRWTSAMPLVSTTNLISTARKRTCRFALEENMKGITWRDVVMVKERNKGQA